MKKREPIAIVFSDLHLNIWSKFNNDLQRTRESFRVLSVLSEKYPDIPAIFCGDLFHKGESIDADLLTLWRSFQLHKNWEMWFIEGNHDLKHRNSIKDETFGLANLLAKPWMYNLAFTRRKLWSSHVYGIPYIDDNVGVNDYLKELIDKYNIGRNDSYSILVIHSTYLGARDTDGREVESPNNINPNLLNKFDLVLCGHIHKPQRLGKKVYIVGCPIQQRRTDMGCKLGYWELYEDLTMVFKELKGFPKFIDVESEDQVKDDGNYYTVIPPKPSKSEVTTHKITKRLTKKALVRKYMKAKGVKDESKKSLLISILNKTEQ